MTRLTQNVLSNLAGTAWLALLQLLVVPIYLGWLGIEGYGLIGFSLVLQGIMRVLDLGLSATVNRELARYATEPDRAGEARHFAWTSEAFCWALSALAAAIVWLAAPSIASHWLQAEGLPPDALVSATRAMGLLAALQWPLGLYQGALMGLERQLLLNVIRAGMMTVAAVAGVLVLHLIAAAVTLFFWSQVAAAAVQAALMRAAMWRLLPASDDRPRLRPELMLTVRRFAAGMTAITVCSLVITQADKVVLSRWLTLEAFGYYTIATIGASALAAFNAPVFNAMFPRLTSLVAQRQDHAVAPLFRFTSQCVAVATIPAALVVAFFSVEILTLWTRDPVTARQAAPVLSVLIIGTALNSLMVLPYALQLAYGWTRLAFQLNVAFAVVIVPALLLAVSLRGVVGAALVWCGINLVYVLIGVPATHRRIFGDAGRHWFADVGRILGATIPVVGAWWLMDRALALPPASPIMVIGASLSGLAAAAAAAGLVRGWMYTYVAHRLGRAA